MLAADWLLAARAPAPSGTSAGIESAGEREPDGAWADQTYDSASSSGTSSSNTSSGSTPHVGTPHNTLASADRDASASSAATAAPGASAKLVAATPLLSTVDADAPLLDASKAVTEVLQHDSGGIEPLDPIHVAEGLAVPPGTRSTGVLLLCGAQAAPPGPCMDRQLPPKPCPAC